MRNFVSKIASYKIKILIIYILYSSSTFSDFHEIVELLASLSIAIINVAIDFFTIERLIAWPLPT